jgi:hypothetical protein
MSIPISRGIGARVRWLALVALTALAVGACGEAPPSASPTAAPTPTPTPNPHLGDPTTADAVYHGLGFAGLDLTANNANAGGADSDVVKRINATYLGWPLNITEYRTSAALRKATKWGPTERPGQGDAPVAIAAANILVTWGPQTGGQPPAPDARQTDGLDDLVAALDRLLSPMRARSIVAISVPSVLGGADGPADSPDATTADGEATSRP